MNTKLLALYGLKWHPFTTEVPTEAIHVPARLEHFCWRIEQGLIGEGGFAMIHGDPGTGKSVALRLLAERLPRDFVTKRKHLYRRLAGRIFEITPGHWDDDHLEQIKNAIQVVG